MSRADLHLHSRYSMTSTEYLVRIRRLQRRPEQRPERRLESQLLRIELPERETESAAVPPAPARCVA